MTFSKKIDEWILEAEARPASALLILKLVANRLKDLTERNEQLLAENIALQNETRVEEYQKRIVHLEYQLDLLKRGGGVAAEKTPVLNLLVYNAAGRILRLELETALENGWRLQGEAVLAGEWPRLLAASPAEDLLFLFTSGRVETFSAAQIAPAGASPVWERAPLPVTPRAGERLAALLPLARLPLLEFFVQASRRGALKKTPTSLAESVFSKHFLGRGVIEKNDQPHALLLAQKASRLALVSYEGRLAGMTAADLAFTMEERLRLNATDFLVAALTLEEDQTLLCLTQNGKLIARPLNNLELARGGGRGQALIPPARLAQGTRFVGALTARKEDRLVALDSAGNLRMHSVEAALGAGALPAENLILAIGLLPV